MARHASEAHLPCESTAQHGREEVVVTPKRTYLNPQAGMQRVVCAQCNGGGVISTLTCAGEDVEQARAKARAQALQLGVPLNMLEINTMNEGRWGVFGRFLHEDAVVSAKISRRARPKCGGCGGSGTRLRPIYQPVRQTVSPGRRGTLVGPRGGSRGDMTFRDHTKWPWRP